MRCLALHASRPNWKKATLARIAFALSLVKDGAVVAPSPSFSGGDMKRPTFIGEDEVFLRTLIAHTYGKLGFSEDEFFSDRSIVKNHIHGDAITEDITPPKRLNLSDSRRGEGVTVRALSFNNLSKALHARTQYESVTQET